MYVLDTDALVSIGDHARAGKEQELLDAICDLIVEGEVTYPDEVRDEAFRIADPPRRSWVKAVSGCRRNTNVPYSRAVEVIAACPEIMDGDYGDDEPSRVYVVAMVYHCRAQNIENSINVVSDETAELPDRMTLAAVCAYLQIEHCRTSDFLKRVDSTNALI